MKILSYNKLYLNAPRFKTSNNDDILCNDLKYNARFLNFNINHNTDVVSTVKLTEIRKHINNKNNIVLFANNANIINKFHSVFHVHTIFCNNKLYEHENKIFINDFNITIDKHKMIFVIENNYKLLCKYILFIINAQVLNDQLIVFIPNISTECYIFLIFFILQSYEITILKTLFSKKNNSQYMICTKINNAKILDVITLIKNIETQPKFFIFDNYLPTLHVFNILANINIIWKNSYYKSIL